MTWTGIFFVVLIFRKRRGVTAVSIGKVRKEGKKERQEIERERERKTYGERWSEMLS